MLISKKMMLLNPQLWWTGISIALYSGILTPIMIFQIENDPILSPQYLTTQQKESKALLGMIAFGSGEIWGALAMGLLVDKFGSKKCIYFNLASIVLMVGVTINSIHMEKYNWNTFLMTFMWGI